MFEFFRAGGFPIAVVGLVVFVPAKTAANFVFDLKDEFNIGGLADETIDEGDVLEHSRQGVQDLLDTVADAFPERGPGDREKEKLSDMCGCLLSAESKQYLDVPLEDLSLVNATERGLQSQLVRRQQLDAQSTYEIASRIGKAEILMSVTFSLWNHRGERMNCTRQV